MRIYIIGNDGVALSRQAPGALNKGEIVVASNEELRAAPLSGKQLLALWNALPGVEKRKKVGDRAALIDQLWSAIEALPDPEPQPDLNRPSKQVALCDGLKGRAALTSGAPDKSLEFSLTCAPRRRSRKKIEARTSRLSFRNS